MTKSHHEQWLHMMRQHLQESLFDMKPYLESIYAYDSTGLVAEITVLEESKRGRQMPCKHSLTIKRGEFGLLALELENVQEEEQDQGLIHFLGTVDGVFWPIGTVMKLIRIDLTSGREDSEVAALTHSATLLLQSLAELIICEEQEMIRQPTVLQETWKSMYGFRDEKLVEYDGIRYFRFDAATSWHY